MLILHVMQLEKYPLLFCVATFADVLFTFWLQILSAEMRTNLKGAHRMEKGCEPTAHQSGALIEANNI